MVRDAIIKVSKKMSWLLRHGAAEAGVQLDASGWADIDAVLRALRLDRSAFDAAVAQNDKKRFEVSGDRVRAVQGHTTQQVSRPALEQSWATYDCEGSIWHGTALDALEGIRKDGIRAQQRSHVHLAPSPQSVVGKRANVDVLLEVSTARLRAQGREIWQAPNGVVLVRDVPADCIVSMVPMSRVGRIRGEAIAAELGFALRAEPPSSD